MIFDSVEEDDGLIFITFKDGSRCNEELILPLNETNWTNQLMAEVDSPENIWKFDVKFVGRQEEIYAENADGETVLVQPFVEGRKKITPIPPRKTKSNFGLINNHINNNVVLPEYNNVENKKNEEKKLKETDPVYILMDQSKKNPTDVEMNINILLPPKSLYNIAKESFENGNNKVIDYIIDNLDISLIKESLKDALLKSYEQPVEEIIHGYIK